MPDRNLQWIILEVRLGHGRVAIALLMIVVNNCEAKDQKLAWNPWLAFVIIWPYIRQEYMGRKKGLLGSLSSWRCCYLGKGLHPVK